MMNFRQFLENFPNKEFNKKLSDYQWGPVDKNLKPLKDNDFKNYRTLSPENFEKLKQGTCWDYVEAQRNWYEKHKIPHKTFYFELNNKEKASHTILIAKINNKFVWDEASWKTFKGLHSSTSEKQLLNDMCKKHAKNMEGDQIVVCQYPKPPFGLNTTQFMAWIKKHGKLVMTWKRG